MYRENSAFIHFCSLTNYTRIIRFNLTSFLSVRHIARYMMIQTAWSSAWRSKLDSFSRPHPLHLVVSATRIIAIIILSGQASVVHKQDDLSHLHLLVSLQQIRESHTTALRDPSSISTRDGRSPPHVQSGIHLGTQLLQSWDCRSIQDH